MRLCSFHRTVPFCSLFLLLFLFVPVLILCAFLSLSASPACAGESGINSGSPDMAVRSVNAFALRAAGRLSDDNKSGDFFFSPYSVLSALGMTYAGAKGLTAQEMERTLLFSPDIHASFGALTRELTLTLDGKNDRPLLTSANRVWLQKGLKLFAGFSETLCRDYDSSAAETDFKDNPEASKKKINEWVEAQTHNRIRDLIRKIDPETRMILTNAVYFTGRWADPFDEKRTSPEPFYITPDRTKDVPMMRQNGKFLYAETDDGTKLLRLPYTGRLSMVLVLPEKNSGTQKILSGLSGPDGPEVFALWNKMLSGHAALHQVDLRLPKFKTEERYELNKILTGLGVKQAFSRSANFSGITDDEILRIDSVIHQTFIEVDEKKTEAAAATGVVMVRATAMPPQSLPRAEFHADRPFIYFILDNPTGTILFMGCQSFN